MKMNIANEKVITDPDWCPMSEIVEADLKEGLPLTKTLLMAHLNDAINRILSSFLQNMTDDYFHAIDESDQIAHLSALATTELAGIDQNLMLTSLEDHCFTFINGHNYSGLLSDLIKQLPKDKPLQSAKVFTSNKGDVVIDIFDFTRQRRFDTVNPKNRERLDQVIASVKEYEPDIELDSLIDLLHACAEDYVMLTSDRRICRHFTMVQTLWGNDDVKLETLFHSRDNYLDVTIGFGNGDTRQVFERVCAYLGRHNIDIHRAHFETFQRNELERVSLIGLLVSRPDGTAIDTDHWEWQKHLKYIRRIPVLCDDTIALHISDPDWKLDHAELLHALARLIHQRLCKLDLYRFSLEHIIAVMLKHRTMSCTIFDYILDKFSPDQTRFTDKRILISEEDLLTLPENDTTIMQSLEAAAHSILKTNIHFPSRYALAFRINPDFLKLGDRDVLPHGVFFIHGKSFNGFHIRFRDIARGGMRIVLPRQMDDYIHETSRFYDENYGLAYAQQLKNKDIPEGGSKGVLLVKPGHDYEQCGRAYADSLLDLISPDEKTNPLRIDYLGVDELLYLGPDENVSPTLINWIIQRAHVRNYPMPNTFMSSKPKAGINHKVYGVTSEGVTVFLDAALRQNGIDPTHDTFTIKITGGPDGDVAGNEILILHREYGDRAQILGIADGSGVAEDPQGLDHEELIQLVKNNLPISEYNPEKLGSEGQLNTVDTPEGAHVRDTMHFRVIADAFIPAGGRPQTINSLNWNNFLQKDGTPSSQIIVEGANLFLTTKARKKLSEAGVLIIKDSSANKCGVICSSLEIIAGMLTTESQFATIKSDYVAQTLVRLRGLAAMEARALFQAHRHHPHLTLPELSSDMSVQINRLHDAISNRFIDMYNKDSEQLLREYVPDVLLELIGGNAIDQIPQSYSRQIIASVLASRIVYNEGIDYCRHMNEEDMARLALDYLHREHDVSELINAIEASDLDQKERIAELLKAGGSGAALKV